MTDNPHYDSQLSINEVKSEDPEKIPMANDSFIIASPSAYKVIPSSSLHLVNELGEGAFGKVHLAEYHCKAVEEIVLVAVSLLLRQSC